MYYVPDPEKWTPMEAQRPCCYKEYIGPNKCWEEIGMRISWTVPEVPDVLTVPLFDPLNLRLCLECKKPVAIREVTAWAWTHLFHYENHEGIYREIKLEYDENSRKWDDHGVTTYEFQASVIPTHMAENRLTFNVKFQEYMIWVNKFKTDHVLTIGSLRLDHQLLKTANLTKITPRISIGNYLAMLLADEMNTGLVLNLDAKTEKQAKKTPVVNSKTEVTFNHLDGVQTGGGNEIPREKIKEIVDWIRDGNKKTNKNILVSDRLGMGRVGSALTAYIYANNPHLSYDEAFQYVSRRKPNAFCHKGVRNVVTDLYKRD